MFPVSVVVSRAAQVIRDKAPPLWVRGEVSGWRQLRNGHCYFTLKDDKAELCCTIWSRTARLLPALPSDGMEVDVFGQLTIFERRGQFQMEVMEVAATGIGGLWQVAKERLVAQLRGEGLLDEERKRPLPEFPERVGIVTSAQSAVLHDMHRTLRRKAWWVPVLVSHTAVEGATSADEIARAIRRLGGTREGCPVDVVIVARGGGSMESLWGFNLEPVARAIADCPVPVISAVGHETDYTVADLVADHRAATPTAGADRAVPDGRTIALHVQQWPSESHRRVHRFVDRRNEEVAGLDAGIESGVAGRLRLREMQLDAAGRHLAARNPRQAWLRAGERTDAAALALHGSMNARVAGLARAAGDVEQRTHAITSLRVADAARRLETAEAAIGARSPRHWVARTRERIDELASTLNVLFARRLRRDEREVVEAAGRMDSAIERRLEQRQRLAEGLAALVAARAPVTAMHRVAERLGRLASDFDGSIERRLRTHEQSVADQRPALDDTVLGRLTEMEREFAGAIDALEARSPLRVLARGYAVVSEPGAGRPLRSIHEVNPGARLRVRLADGEFAVRVEPDEPMPAPTNHSTPDDEQRSTA